MPSSRVPWNKLVVYSALHSSPVQRIDARAYQTQQGTFSFEYVLRAQMPGIRIPPARSSARGDELWKHTCFEAFIATTAGPGYYELNFSPSREWAVYRFNGYRHGMAPMELSAPPELRVGRHDDRLELEATIDLPGLAALRASGALKLALTAVVEDDGGGTLSYWALKHAPDKPDFHHSDGFVLELPANL